MAAVNSISIAPVSFLCKSLLLYYYFIPQVQSLQPARYRDHVGLGGGCTFVWVHVYAHVQCLPLSENPSLEVKVLEKEWSSVCSLAIKHHSQTRFNRRVSEHDPTSQLDIPIPQINNGLFNAIDASVTVQSLFYNFTNTIIQITFKYWYNLFIDCLFSITTTATVSV